MRKLLYLTILLLVASPKMRAEGVLPAISAELKVLDTALEHRSEYVAVFEERVDYLESMLAEARSNTDLYELSFRLFGEYKSYNFDSALDYGMRAVSAAKSMGSSSREDAAELSIARLYTMAGMYAEAINFFNRVDTQRLSPDVKIEYYMARIHFNRDFREYSKDLQMREMCGSRLDYYRRRLYEMPRDVVAHTSRYTIDSLSTRVLDYFDHKLYDEALVAAERLVESLSPNQHDYAIAAYYLSMIYGQFGDMEQQALWLVRSATVDTRLAIKDNASMSILASILSTEDEIERAMDYIHISIDDAMFFNAKLRPWQVAARMNTIEQAYHSSVEKQRRNQLVMTILVSILALGILCVCVYMVTLLRKTRRAKDALREQNSQMEKMNEALSQTNRQLQALNLSIAEANMVKEEYIGLFLSMCSDYIDKIASMQRRVRKGIKSGSIAELNREFPSSDIIDVEKEHFYEVFDSAFLNLYPNFVEEFNSLLEPDGQIELKKGERLNTELRIFALIRLGITDSSKIALLLHYSVNTIYNYRAKVKNRSRVNRDDFEQVIRTIGSFKQ